MKWRFALLLLFAARSWACVCPPTLPSIKQAWKDASAIFLGTVEFADPDEDISQIAHLPQSVRIRVDEAFKGVSRGQTIDLRQGSTDCDVIFRSGQRAVFYLQKGMTRGSWNPVMICSHALGSAEPAGDDLLFLRGLPNSAIGTRLSGTVVGPYGDGVPNIRVKIVGPMGFIQKAATNAAGAYVVFGLRPARYSISIEVPNGLKVWLRVVTGSLSVQGDDAAVVLKPGGGAGVDFILQADTRLSRKQVN